MEKKIQAVFCFGSIDKIKQAILFNEHVVPFPFEMGEIWNGNGGTSLSRIEQAIYEHVPPHVYKKIASPFYPPTLKEILLKGNADKKELTRKIKESYPLIGHFQETQVIYAIMSQKIKNTGQLPIDDHLHNMKFWNRLGFNINVIMPDENLQSPKATSDDISVMLNGIDLIDTTKTSWDLLLEIRENNEAKKKLRNLKLFLMTNYDGKSREFIEDDLAKRIDEYNCVVKEYNFQTKLSTLTLISNSKNMRTFGTASLIAAYADKPLIASSALVTGVGMEIFNLTLNVISKKHAFSQFKKNHELAYIMDFKKID